MAPLRLYGSAPPRTRPACVWGVFGVSLGCLWGIFGVSLGCLWGVLGVSLGLSLAPASISDMHTWLLAKIYRTSHDYTKSDSWCWGARQICIVQARSAHTSQQFIILYLSAVAPPAAAAAKPAHDPSRHNRA